MQSINPFNNELLSDYQEMSSEEVNSIIDKTHKSWLSWKKTSFAFRSDLMLKAANRGFLGRKHPLLSVLI